MTGQPFGTTDDGQPVERATITADGLTARVMTWGAVLQDLRLEGIDQSLVLGYPDFASYPAHSPNFGAIVGRVANRIRNAQAPIDGEVHKFDRNCLGRHILHGGTDGCGVRVWRIMDAGDDFVRLGLQLPDGHMGFPGTLDIEAVYRVLPGPALAIEIIAKTDQLTLCNLAHHSYFNLNGSGDGRDQRLQIAADAFLPVDGDLVPTGEVRPVAGTAFDFRQARAIRRGDTRYDHNFCLAETRGPLRPVATLSGKAVSMTIETTEPGLQLYDGATIPTFGGFGPYAGIALEPQAWPDAPNQAWAGQVTLAPGQIYQQTTHFRFARL
jgi:aldose 1-epimerase